MSQLDAEGVVETGGSEDEVSFEGWLKSKGLQAIAPVLQQAGLTLKDLLHCSEDDVRSTLLSVHITRCNNIIISFIFCRDLCQQLKISPLHRIKLISKLKETPGSGAVQKEIVFLGDDEKKILDRAFKKTEVIGGDIKSIQAAIIGMN